MQARGPEPRLIPALAPRLIARSIQYAALTRRIQGLPTPPSRPVIGRSSVVDRYASCQDLAPSGSEHPALGPLAIDGAEPAATFLACGSL